MNPQTQDSDRAESEVAGHGRGSSQEYADAKQQGPKGTAWDSSLRYLGIRSHSRFEIRRKLDRRGYPKEEIDAVLTRLENAGLVDDRQFARELTRSLLSSKSASRREISRQLAKRGVDPEQAEAAVDSITAHEEHERARALAEKKMRQLLQVSKDVRWRRTLGYLNRRGFSEGTCYAVVRDVEEMLTEELGHDG